MNQIEADFGAHLRFSGEVIWQRYEGITLKLGDDVRYTPDWFALKSDGELWCYEVKGPYKREDAMIKLRTAASMFPFRFVLVERGAFREGWTFKEL